LELAKNLKNFLALTNLKQWQQLTEQIDGKWLYQIAQLKPLQML